MRENNEERDRMRIGIKALILLSVFYAIGMAGGMETKNPALLYPERYIKITDWSFYVAWGGEAIVHHVTIENTSDVAYKNIIVVRYYSGSYSNTGTQVGAETGVLPILVPPHTRGTYLDGGVVLGAGSSSFHAGGIEVLGATPVVQ